MRRAQRAAGRNQFVAGRQDRDPGAPAHAERFVVGRRSKRDVAGSEPAAGREQGLARLEVHAGLTQIVAGRSRDRKPDALILALDILLNDDGVGAVRHGRAGEDAHRFAGTQRAGERASGGGLADHRQRRRRRRGVDGAQRVAIHGGVGKRRLGAQGLKVARQHAAVSLVEGDLFLLERRLGGGEHAPERLLDCDH